MAVRAAGPIVAPMATQSLYRRYRPRRFSEVRGQDHVVKALRTSVAEGREGQAYLFSGPRGTGKTTSARILAKVLNCTDAKDGEPCCECESCLSVERGTSYDVHELDAASNNGVDSMRDLIDKASLGTPGRHKVYILDEVHMLTKPAEAALLKTLEEPPPHVVFVLATTDPQKMSDTIRSRTQHLQFHLLPADTLQQHVRWVAEDAGLTVSDAAIEQVLAQGGGSARDTLSALELVANTGGEGVETVPLGEFVEAMAEQDAGRALTMAAGAIGLGRDPRTLTEELIGYLRNGFLLLMAPDLVQLPADRVAALSEQAQRLGAAGLVRGIEYLGEALTEMRHAPDPRVLLDVAIVKLTAAPAASGDAGPAVAALATRIAKLEQQIAQGVPAPAPAPAAIPATDGQAAVATAVPARADAAPADAAAAAPRDPSTGRAALGGRARRPSPAESTAPAPTGEPTDGGADGGADGGGPEATTSSSAPGENSAPAPSTTRTVKPVPAASTPASSAQAGSAMTQPVWDDTVKPALRGMARAVYSPATYVSNSDTTLTLSLPNPVHRDKCEQHRGAVETALAAAVGSPVTLDLVIAGDDGGDGGSAGGSGGPAPTTSETPAGGGGTADPQQTTSSASNSEPIDPSHPAAGALADAAAPSDLAEDSRRVASEPALQHPSATPVPEAAPRESPRRAAERKAAEAASNGTAPAEGDDESAASEAEIHVLPQDHEVDLTELVDAPPETVKTPIDRLAEAFPGSELVSDTY